MSPSPWRRRFKKPSLEELVDELVRRDDAGPREELGFRERFRRDWWSRHLGRSDYTALLQGYYARRETASRPTLSEPPNEPPETPWSRPGSRSRFSALSERVTLCLGLSPASWAG